MNRWIAGFVFVVFASVLVGCETMKGAGRDLQDTGHNIQSAASK